VDNAGLEFDILSHNLGLDLPLGVILTGSTILYWISIYNYLYLFNCFLITALICLSPRRRME
jgi:hypothetical protein